MLLPSAFLVLLNRAEPMAERRVYFASAGLFLAAGTARPPVATAFESARRLTRVIGRDRAAIVADRRRSPGRTIVRNVVWSSPILLWAEAAELSPESLVSAARAR